MDPHDPVLSPDFVDPATWQDGRDLPKTKRCCGDRVGLQMWPGRHPSTTVVVTLTVFVLRHRTGLMKLVSNSWSTIWSLSMISTQFTGLIVAKKRPSLPRGQRLAPFQREVI